MRSVYILIIRLKLLPIFINIKKLNLNLLRPMLVFSSLSGVVVSRLFDFHFCLTAPVTTSKNWTESGARRAHLSEILFFRSS